VLSRSHLVVDALVGYGLNGVPRGRVSSVIDLCNRHAARILSLDVPSGLDGTTGEAPGAVVRPERTLTLALPKTGLRELAGDLYLADVGIPPEVLEKIGVSFTWPFGERYWVRLESRA
jgi:NAD(P)H-hydrate epimerase